MKRLITLITVIAIIVGFNCIAQAEEIVVDQDNLRIVEEHITIETREDLEEERVELVARLAEVDRKLALLGAERDR